MDSSGWNVFTISMLFNVAVQIIGRDWKFWDRLGAVMIVSPLGTLIGLTMVLIEEATKR